MRWPFWPTLLVTLAVATMIGLGVWQLQRKGEKEALLAQYAAAAKQPEMAWPVVPGDMRPYLFRKADAFCLQVVGWRSVAGRNVKGEAGWSHIAACRTGAEGPGINVDAGWSRDPADPRGWKGGPLKGVIAPAGGRDVKLVSSVAAAGLQPSAPPGLETIPNNHLPYAIQWFLFAGAAAIIYVLALRKRGRTADLPKAG